MPKHVVRHLMHKHSQELGGSNEVMNDEPMFSSGESDHLAGFEMDEALDEDDYHFQTKQINILAQSRKSIFIIVSNYSLYVSKYSQTRLLQLQL